MRRFFGQKRCLIGISLLLSPGAPLKHECCGAPEAGDLTFMGGKNAGQRSAECVFGGFAFNCRAKAVPCGCDIPGDENQPWRKAGDNQLQSSPRSEEHTSE